MVSYWTSQKVKGNFPLTSDQIEDSYWFVIIVTYSVIFIVSVVSVLAICVVFKSQFKMSVPLSSCTKENTISDKLR